MLKSKLLGATAAAEDIDISDYFSTYLYTGNGSTQTITNGIDLAGEGGLVWTKSRSNANQALIYDTVRGINSYLIPSSTQEAQTSSGTLTTFSSDGFTLGANDNSNDASGESSVSWTFRKAERFFDVVTYTGTGANRTVAHNLGVVPGCIIVKKTNTTANWQVYHRSLANTQYLVLNLTNAVATGLGRWNSTTPTSTVFTLGADTTVNANGDTYVAYLFAHDPLGPSGDGSDGLIACGSYTGNGASVGPTVTLGWEPQWILIKRASGGTEHWYIFDNMRGMTVGGSDAYLLPSSSSEEFSFDGITPTSTGFNASNSFAATNASGSTYIYIAIRRGPMREPTSGTEVFAVDGENDTAPNPPTYNSGFAVDLSLMRRNVSGTESWYAYDRLRGNGPALQTNSTAAEVTAGGSYNSFDSNTGLGTYTGTVYPNAFAWMFRRAPGFFDVVAYTGTGSVSTFAHNLGVKPQMIWTKGRNDSTFGWYVYHEAVTAEDQLYLHLTNAAGGGFMNNTEPTDEVFTLGVTSGANASGEPFIAYLFATLAGVSKVGSYTGNGSSQTINCGFTGGARFVLIKRTSATGDWYVWDTARGIVAGNDPHLSLNTTAAEVTTNDSIDPDSSGFIVNQLAATNINVNAASYIYFAVS